MNRENIRERHGSNLYPAKLEQTFGPHQLELDVPAGVWNPTPHGVHLGNMLLELDFHGSHVLELGTGCGIHAILMARQGASKLSLTEITQEVLDNAEHNLKKHDVKKPIRLIVADWTTVPLADDGELYDVMVTNPPFAKSGKRYRRYFIDKLILDAHRLVRPGGRLIFIQSSMADIPRSIALMSEHGMQVRIVGETSGPFRPYYFEDDAFMRDIAAMPDSYAIIDGVHRERLIVFEATLPE